MSFKKKLPGLLFTASLFFCSCAQSVQEKKQAVRDTSPGSLPYYASPDFTAAWYDKPPERMHRIAAFSFEDQNGKIINTDFVKGRPYLAGFFFASCRGICPILTTNLQYLKQSVDTSFHIPILFHSVMPETDSREVLHRYATSYELNDDWHLLTGNRDSIYTLARKSYFADEDLGMKKGPGDFLHTENILLIDSDGHIRGIYKGTSKLEMQAIDEDLHKLEAETAKINKQ